MDTYKRNKRSYNELSKLTYGMTFGELIELEDKSPEMKKTIRDYYKYTPLFFSD